MDEAVTAGDESDEEGESGGRRMAEKWAEMVDVVKFVTKYRVIIRVHELRLLRKGVRGFLGG